MSNKPYYADTKALGLFSSYSSLEEALEQAVRGLTRFKNFTEGWVWSNRANTQFLVWNKRSLYRDYESTGISVNLDQAMTLKYGDTVVPLPECDGMSWNQVLDYVQPIITDLIEEEINQLLAHLQS